MTVDKSSSILVVGAGTFGLSTAWQLAKEGYRSITVLDKYEAPSIASAGHDLNKVFRTQYSNPLYARLAVEARDAWIADPLFKPAYHEAGYIFAVSGESQASIDDWQQACDNSRALGAEMTELKTKEEYLAKAPFMQGEMKDWKAVYIPGAGWTHAEMALTALTNGCLRLGVRFISGADGAADTLLYSSDGKQVLGVRAESGREHRAGQTILCVGAWLSRLLDVEGMISAKAWCLVHIDLTEEEAALWADGPVINNRVLGYMFEPDAKNRKLKVAPQLPGYTHFVSPTLSYPRSKAEHPSDGIPTEAQALIRKFLAECVPSLAQRPFSFQRLCWDAETPDAHLIISKHPTPGLLIAGGGSAHAFKFLPILGKYVQQVLEGSLDKDSDLAKAWAWGPRRAVPNTSLNISVPTKDLSAAKGWKHDERL